MITQCASGCLFGLAFGDALGFKTEFLSVNEIVTWFPPNGPQELVGTPAFVTDDTQMALAVGEALLMAPKPFAPDTLEGPMREAFVDWANSPDNRYHRRRLGGRRRIGNGFAVLSAVPG